MNTEMIHFEEQLALFSLDNADQKKVISKRSLT